MAISARNRIGGTAVEVKTGETSSLLRVNFGGNIYDILDQLCGRRLWYRGAGDLDRESE